MSQRNDELWRDVVGQLDDVNQRGGEDTPIEGVVVPGSRQRERGVHNRDGAGAVPAVINEAPDVPQLSGWAQAVAAAVAQVVDPKPRVHCAAGLGERPGAVSQPATSRESAGMGWRG